MRRTFILFFVVSLSFIFVREVSAQRTGLTASFGKATFQMDDMKYLQDYILSTYPLEGKTISSFPPYYSTSFGALRQLYTHLRIGAEYTYTSTGGKSNYTDYSGSITTSMIAISHRFGAFINYTILGGDHLDLSLYGKLDANLTKLDITSSIYTYGTSNGISNSYRSISPNGTVGLELLYNFEDAAIGISGGYLVDLPADLSNKESGNELLDPNDRQRILTSDWTGWRFDVKGIIWFNFQ